MQPVCLQWKQTCIELPVRCVVLGEGTAAQLTKDTVNGGRGRRVPCDLDLVGQQ